MKQAGEEAPTPHEAESLKPGEAEVPSLAKATKGEAKASRTSEAEVAEVGAPRASKAKVADAGAPRTTKAEVAGAGVPRTIEAEVAEAGVGAAGPAAQDAEMEVGQALSMEVEDLRLRCADTKAKAAMAQEQATPLATWIKELEEELTRVASEQDAFRSRAKQLEISAKAIAGQLVVEQGVHLLTKGALAEALKVAEASRVEALAWKEKAEGESC
ncbi:uncharacterized protein [Miscanthus floridulus]|uniref:uncharacterized protein n=1 Tax=Miscanthus floridulus TaxID=154761 RepID=UPI0034588D30